MYGSSNRKPSVGIDYDDTLDKLPIMFMKMVKDNMDSIDFYVVTYRNRQPYTPLMQEFVDLTGNEVIFTNGQAKRDVALFIDIWIDDRPISITHTFTDGGFTPSRVTKNLYLQRKTCILHYGVTNCGYKMDTGMEYNFCPNCGNKLLGG